MCSLVRFSPDECGQGPDPRLHWFELRNGSYWITVGEVELFRFAGLLDPNDTTSIRTAISRDAPAVEMLEPDYVAGTAIFA